MELVSEIEIETITREVIDKFVIPAYNDKGHNASGELLASFRSRAEGNKGIISGASQAQYLIFGRRPNKDQSPEAINQWVRWAIPAIIQPWMATKGLSGSAFPIAYTIATEGTRQHRKGLESFLAVLDSQEVRDYVIDRVKGMLTLSVKQILRDKLLELNNA